LKNHHTASDTSLNKKVVNRTFPSQVGIKATINQIDEALIPESEGTIPFGALAILMATDNGTHWRNVLCSISLTTASLPHHAFLYIKISCNYFRVFEKNQYLCTALLEAN